MECKWDIEFHHKDGTITDFDNYNKKEVVKVRFIPKFNSLPFEFSVTEDKEFIFWKRWTKELMTNKVKKILYFFGYIHRQDPSSAILFSFDPVTEELSTEDASEIPIPSN